MSRIIWAVAASRLQCCLARRKAGKRGKGGRTDHGFSGLRRFVRDLRDDNRFFLKSRPV